MKKIISVMIALVTVLCLFTACNGKTPADNTDGLNIVTTIFPIYDWVRNIADEEMEHVNLTLLLDSGTDLHSFQPSAQDILNIIHADLFIYVGGESDKWVDDVLKQADNPDMVVINLMEALGDRVKEEEVVGSMQEEEEEEEEEEAEFDEHVWLSLKNAADLCDTLVDALGEIDPAHKNVYAGNAAEYKEKLLALDARYKEVVDASDVKTLVFGDRFPFRYLADDYGLSYDAAFVGCSAETEASFETVSSLANTLDELGLKYIFTIEGSNHRIAETVVNTTKTKDQKILTLNSLQSVTANDVKNGADYLSIMESNLEVLREALN